MKLPIYSSKGSNPCVINVNELLIDWGQQPEILPRLYGELATPASQELTLLLRVHNRAGIPIVEGKSKVAVGQKSVTFSEWRAVGIEGYAHMSEMERRHILSRIWSRYAYGTIACL